MQKKLTVLFAFAIFVLVVGWAVTPAQAHCPKKDGAVHSGNHPHCTKIGTEDGEYSVAIDEAVEGQSDDLWRLSSGGKQIGLGNLSGQVIGQLDLSFFTVPTPGGPFSTTRGINCFSNSDVELSPQASIKKGRRGRAEGHFWFGGKTDDGVTTVLYALDVFGLFEQGAIWPPSSTTSMVMTDWEIRVEGEGDVVKNISCIGEGKFDDFGPDTMNIVVTLE